MCRPTIHLLEQSLSPPIMIGLPNCLKCFLMLSTWFINSFPLETWIILLQMPYNWFRTIDTYKIFKVEISNLVTYTQNKYLFKGIEFKLTSKLPIHSLDPINVLSLSSTKTSVLCTISILGTDSSMFSLFMIQEQMVCRVL